jgi:transposase
MFRQDKTIERQLFAYTPRDLLPEDSDVYLYIDLFSSLDLDEFYYAYSSQGQDSVDPRLMLRTIFYGLTHGISTGRKLQAACSFDNRFMVLCGGYRPSYRCFARFLVRHLKHIENLFVDIVRVAQEIGIVKLGQVAIDGTRIKGYTSKSHTLKAGKLDPAIEKIKEELKILRDDLNKAAQTQRNELGFSSLPNDIKCQEKRREKIRQARERLEREAKAKGEKVKEGTQISVNDPDARMIGGGKKEPVTMGYNMQAAADAEHQIIIAAEIHDNSADLHAYGPMMDKIVETCGKAPGQTLSDAGYLSIDNISKTTALGSEPIMSLYKAEEKRRLEFVRAYKKRKDSYRCRAGHPLHGKLRPKKEKSCQSLSVTIPLERCKTCRHKDLCPFAGGKKKVSILAPDERKVMLSHTVRAKSWEFKETYRLRKAIIEPVFANIKTHKRLSLHHVGREKASMWWKMVCTAANIEKIVKYKATKKPL